MDMLSNDTVNSQSLHLIEWITKNDHESNKESQSKHILFFRKKNFCLINIFQMLLYIYNFKASFKFENSELMAPTF